MANRVATIRAGMFLTICGTLYTLGTPKNERSGEPVQAGLCGPDARQSLLEGGGIEQALADQLVQITLLQVNDRTSRAASGQEAADGERAIVEVVPDKRVADAIGLLDHSAIRHREPLSRNHYSVRILGHVPFDLVRPKAVGGGAATTAFVIRQAFHPAFDIRRNLCVLTVVPCLRSKRSEHQSNDDKCSCEHRDLRSMSAHTPA